MSLADATPFYLIGAGKMGLALAKGWLAAGLNGTGVTFVDPNPGSDAKALAAKYGVNLAQTVPDASPRVLVLAVKPQIIGPVMAELRSVVGPDTLVLSIAAGVNIETLSDRLGTSNVVRTMPNTPAQVGKGVTGAVAARGLSSRDHDLADALLRAAGEAVWVPEERLLDALTAVSGSGPAYVFLLAEAMAAAGVAQGLDAEQAMVLARQTVIGAAALMEADPTDVATLRENVTSPGGVTAAALEVLLHEDGMRAMMARAIDAATKRNAELGQVKKD